jgi:pimeloyl-ACP methyl ester carboxylesterase
MDTVVSADGTTVAYDRVGRGTPLVLVHGAAIGRAKWERVIPLLAPYHTIYAIDRRGRGASGDAARYDLAREVEDVMALLAAIGEPAHLFGHSYGAIICLEAARLTGGLRSLLLYEPPFATGVDRVPPDLGDRLAALMQAGDREAVVTTFLREGPRRSPEEIAQLRAQPEWSGRLALAPTIPRELQAVNSYVFEAARLADVPFLTLLLVGSESPPFFHETTRTLHQTLTHSEVAILAGQHHNAMDSAPELLVETILRFTHPHRVAER